MAVARELERRHPTLMTAAWWKEERGARIFVDFNQNAPHKTVFAPWSVRARSMAPVSCPIRWDEVDAIRPDDLTIAVVPERIRQLGDPWATIDDEPNSLEPLLDLVARDQANGLVDAPWPPVYPKMEGEPPASSHPSRAKKPRGAATQAAHHAEAGEDGVEVGLGGPGRPAAGRAAVVQRSRARST